MDKSNLYRFTKEIKTDNVVKRIIQHHVTTGIYDKPEEIEYKAYKAKIHSRAAY